MQSTWTAPSVPGALALVLGLLALGSEACVPPAAPPAPPREADQELTLPTAYGGRRTEAPPPPAPVPAGLDAPGLAGEEGADGAPRAEPSPPSVPSSTVAGDFLGPVRQVVFEGRRSGEGYFSSDGDQMVFQSERVPGNPFYQIHVMDLEAGDVTRVSPGIGKTTCAWIHPEGDRVLFASTHEDPEAEAKMREELDFRASGKKRRYSWDYDPTFELYSVPVEGGEPRRLTNARGYDAEGSWSPDGEWIVFASNRRAFGAEGYAMSEDEASRFEVDPSSMIDIYRMRADGTALERLTDHYGYDGGPFYSPDGERITFRRFDAEGKTAEIWTMAADGSDKRPLTALGAMSWAPFYHPSGDYIVFTTNIHGYGNFELYLVDVEGRRGPVRVTDREGFDGLPVFTPSGDALYWTSNGIPSGQAQIVAASWDDAVARVALGIDGEGPAPARPPPSPLSRRTLAAHVAALTGEEMEGRLTGTRGEALATGYVAQVFEQHDLEPAGDDGSWYQSFEFVSGVRLEGENRLRVITSTGASTPALNEGWRPLAFSETGRVPTASVAFAGYGVVAPETEDQAAYDAYGELDVEGKWVVVFRYLPEAISPERRQYLARFASLRFKAMEARDRGAAGLVVVSGPSSKVKDELAPLRFDAAVSGSGVPAISVTDAVGEALLGRSLAPLQTALDDGESKPGFVAPARVEATIGLALERSRGRNVLARLRLAPDSAAAPVVVGAHIDHLGRGEAGDSLAKPEEAGQVHPGADDNASGVAGMLEIARWLSEEAGGGELDGARRDVIFAAWSGEELGLYGSSHFVEALEQGDDRLAGEVYAYLNMDMIGRLDEAVVVQAVGSSSVWSSLLEAANAVAQVPVRTSADAYLPTDATPFYLAGVPILSAFTGAHPEYHTPRDTPDLLNIPGTTRIAGLVGRLARRLALREEPVDYVKVEPPKRSGGRMGRVYLGTIPDYAANSGEGSDGVLLSGVSAGSPVEEAGVKAGDVLVGLAGQRIGNIYDFVKVLGALKIGEEVPIVVLRDGERVELRVTPASRE